MIAMSQSLFLQGETESSKTMYILLGGGRNPFFIREKRNKMAAESLTTLASQSLFHQGETSYEFPGIMAGCGESQSLFVQGETIQRAKI